MRIRVLSAVIVLVGVAACGGGDSAPSEASSGSRLDTAADACRGDDVLRVDVDGDREDDAVYHRSSTGQPVLGVCTSSGLRDEIDGAGMAQILMAVDVQGDGRDEVFFGATTAGEGLMSLAVLDEGELTAVRRTEGDTLVLRSGRPGPDSATAVGCEDLDGDGVGDVVQVEVTFDGETGEWATTGYRLTDALAEKIASEAGAVEGFSPNRHETAQQLTEPCEFTRP